MLIQHKTKKSVVATLNDLHTGALFSLIDEPHITERVPRVYMKLVDRNSLSSEYCPVVVLDTGYQTSMLRTTRTLLVKATLIVD